MKSYVRLAAIGGPATLTTAVLTGTSLAGTRQHAAPLAGEVFVQTDAVSGNAVAVYDRAADGTLRAAGTYPTGGLGGVLTGSVVDHLASQRSLAYDRTRGLLYAVNARDGGSVQGFLRVGPALVKIPAWHRDLGLNLAQTPEFTSSPGQVTFTPDGSKLIVTTKGNGNDIDGQYRYVQAGANGTIDEYHVNPGSLLTAIGSVPVPGAAGGEGIAAS